MVGSSLKILFRGGEFNEMDMLNKNMVNNVLSIQKWNWYKLKHMLSFYHYWILYYECVFQKWLRRFRKKSGVGTERASRGVRIQNIRVMIVFARGVRGIFPITYHVKFFKFPFFRPPTPNRSAHDIWNRTVTRSFQYYSISQIFFYITYRSTFWYTLSYIEPQFFVTIKQNAGSTDTCIILY